LDDKKNPEENSKQQ